MTADVTEPSNIWQEDSLEFVIFRLVQTNGIEWVNRYLAYGKMDIVSVKCNGIKGTFKEF